MLNRIAWTTSRIVAHKGGPISRLLYSMATIYVRSYHNLNYDMATNGENFVMDRLASQRNRIIFDVGANKGDYTLACLSRFPDATIHAFEIVPDTFEKLRANVVASDRVVLNDFGLSNVAGTLDLNYNPSHDGASSLLEITAIHDASWEKRAVQVQTGDAYCRAAGLETIDLLKIDVEGAENLVLDGFRETLGRGGVKAIQFEFGLANIYSKFLLHDFWGLLTGYDFVLGPIMPNGVMFKDYSPEDEDFQGAPNYFAVLKTQPATIDAVRRR